VGPPRPAHGGTPAACGAGSSRPPHRVGTADRGEFVVTDVRSALVVAEADEFTRAFFAGQLTADGYKVLTALGSARVGSRAAGGAVDLLVDTVPARLGQVA